MDNFAATIPSFLSPSASADPVTKMLLLLLKVPKNARTNFARTHLSAHHPKLVQAFDRIPLHRRARTVLFASFTPHTRECRLAAAARLAGWEPYHVCNGTPKYTPADYFSFSAQLPDPIFLTLACWLFPGALIHAFAMSGEQAILLAWLKPRRLVIDLYDTCSGSLSSSVAHRQQEREVIATADGIIHRDLRIKRLQKLHGYKLPKHNILIHDPLPKAARGIGPRNHNEEIHVVSTGWISAGDNSIIRVARAFCAHQIHLHVYFNPFQQGVHPDTQCYWDLQKNSPFFHIERPVFGDDYWDALRKYDFGLSVLEPAVFGEKIANYTEDALAACGSSRLSDYIAADLGVIVSPELNFQSFWSRRFAITTVSATQEFIANPVPALRQALGTRAQRPPVDRASITIAGAARRLSAFYKKVAA